MSKTPCTYAITWTTANDIMCLGLGLTLDDAKREAEKVYTSATDDDGDPIGPTGYDDDVSHDELFWASDDDGERVLVLDDGEPAQYLGNSNKELARMVEELEVQRLRDGLQAVFDDLLDDDGSDDGEGWDDTVATWKKLRTQRAQLAQGGYKSPLLAEADRVGDLLLRSFWSTSAHPATPSWPASWWL
jgi:hypothetical protein